MPRPEQVVPRAGEDAPYGSTAKLQRQAAGSPLAAHQQPGHLQPTPAVGGDQKVSPEVSAQPPGTTPVPQGDLNDGLDAYLFGDTARPGEPITSGVDFGAGPTFVPRPAESERDFLLRTADAMTKLPSAGTEVRLLAERIRRGD